MQPGTTTNGTRQRLATEAWADHVLGSDDVRELKTGVAATAFELLSHYWSRPVAEEFVVWTTIQETAEEIRIALATDQTLRQFQIPAKPDEVLDEHERLFVGPGPVSCPPYESFWRLDVPVDIRRTLMGPCTADWNDSTASSG